MKFIIVGFTVLLSGTLLSIFAPDPGAVEYFIYTVGSCSGAITALAVTR